MQMLHLHESKATISWFVVAFQITNSATEVTGGEWEQRRPHAFGGIVLLFLVQIRLALDGGHHATRWRSSSCADPIAGRELRALGDGGGSESVPVLGNRGVHRAGTDSVLAGQDEQQRESSCSSSSSSVMNSDTLPTVTLWVAGPPVGCSIGRQVSL